MEYLVVKWLHILSIVDAAVWWVALGIVAFLALVVVFYLMVAKPA